MWTFASFQFDRRTRVLTHLGAIVPLEGKAAEVLSLLAAARGEIVTKEELRQALWPAGTVEEGSLYQAVYVLRRALEATAPDDAPFVETVGRAGYRLVPAISEVRRPSSWRGRRFQAVAAAIGIVGLSAFFASQNLRHVAANDAPTSENARRAHAIGTALVEQRTLPALRKSIAYFQSIVDEEPQSAAGYADLASAYTIMLGYVAPRDGREAMRKAERYVDEVLRRDPNNADALADKAYLALLHGDGAAAESLLKRALASDPVFSRGWEMLGVTDLENAKPGDAAADLERAVRLDPKSATYLRWLGVARYFSGDLAGAIGALHQSSDLAPSMATLYFLFLTADAQHDVAAERRALLALTRTQLPKPKVNALRIFLQFRETLSAGRRTALLANLRYAAGFDLDARYLLALAYRDLGRDRDAAAEVNTLRVTDQVFADAAFFKSDPHPHRIQVSDKR